MVRKLCGRLEVAGDMAATVSEDQRDGWMLLPIFLRLFVCFQSRTPAHRMVLSTFKTGLPTSANLIETPS